MNADGSGQRRISFGEGRYSTPVWSPRGDLIAFTKQIGGELSDRGDASRTARASASLTEGFHNEGPTWAPNGRVLAFFRESRAAPAGRASFPSTSPATTSAEMLTPAFGSDPAWSPQRN